MVRRLRERRPLTFNQPGSRFDTGARFEAEFRQFADFGDIVRRNMDIRAILAEEDGPTTAR